MTAESSGAELWIRHRFRIKKKEVGVIKKDSNSKKKIGKQKISEGPVNQVRSLCSENVIGIVQLKRPLEINMSPS